MRVPTRLIANAILVVIVVTVLPVIIYLLLYPQDFPLDNLLLGFQLGFYMTLPTGISLAAAYLLAKSYFAHGQGSILTFGSAVLMWGWVNVAGGIVFLFIASTLGPGWAIESIGFLLSSMLHLSGAFPSIGKVASNQFLKYRLTLAYASITVAAAILSYASFTGFASAFFGVGGSTLLDKSFTLLSIILFSASSIFFFIKAQKRAKPLFQYWYSVGLAIFAVTSIPSLWGVSGVIEAGDLNALAVLMGCLCFFISALVYLKENLDIKK